MKSTYLLTYSFITDSAHFCESQYAFENSEASHLDHLKVYQICRFGNILISVFIAIIFGTKLLCSVKVKPPALWYFKLNVPRLICS